MTDSARLDGLDMTLRPPGRRGRWMSEDCRPGLVSVIVPTYNRTRFLLQAMDSVRAQTYRPVELVLVDDGSTDGTPEAVGDWAARSTADDAFELRYIRQRNQGAPVARNRGLSECRGEYVMFLDSDDLIGRTKLAASVARLAGTGPLSVAHGPWRCLYWGPAAGYGPLQRPDAFGDDTGRLLAYISGAAGMPPCVYLFRRAAVLAVGPWDDGLRQRQDTDYLVRALMAGCCFVAEERSVVCYRRHSLQHVGHPANFRRHFASLLVLADKWHGLLLDGSLPPHVAPALHASMMHLLREACIARHAPSVSRCRQRIREWFGEDALRAADAPAFRRRVWVKRTLARPMRRVLGELPLAYAKELVRRCRGIAPVRRPARSSLRLH